MRKFQHGFSLIELLIVIVIIGVLSAIAIPNYNDYVTRSKLKEATAQLSGMRARMEQYYQDNHSYVGACKAGTIAPLPSSSEAKYFSYACPTLTDTTYSITATGIQSKGTGGFGFSVNQSNQKTTTGVPSGWTTPNPNQCWVSARGGKC